MREISINDNITGAITGAHSSESKYKEANMIKRNTAGSWNKVVLRCRKVHT